jgi:hypothetical protein
VQLVRFLTRDSIEEELAGERGYREGLIRNLDDDYVKVRAEVEEEVVGEEKRDMVDGFEEEEEMIILSD